MGRCIGGSFDLPVLHDLGLQHGVVTDKYGNKYPKARA